MRRVTLVYCSWDDCQIGYAVSGQLPKTCPKCDRDTRWTTTPPYKLTVNDKRFLHSLRIDSEEDG